MGISAKSAGKISTIIQQNRNVKQAKSLQIQIRVKPLYQIVQTNRQMGKSKNNTSVITLKTSMISISISPGLKISTQWVKLLLCRKL